MSPTQGRSPIQYPVYPSASVMMGWLPSAPTLLQRVHVLQLIATHRLCCSPQIPVSPGSPLAVPARLLRVAALVLSPRSPPSCVAPARRPHSSPQPPPPLVAPAGRSAAGRFRPAQGEQLQESMPKLARKTRSRRSGATRAGAVIVVDQRACAWRRLSQKGTGGRALGGR
jgi:hypothetical protein